MLDADHISVLHPDLSKLYAYGDFEVRASYAIKVLKPLAPLYLLPESEEVSAQREAILKVPRSEEEQVKQLVSAYDVLLDPNDKLNRVGRIGKNLNLSILYLELGRQLEAMGALKAAITILGRPILDNVEDFLVHPELTDEDVRSIVMGIYRRITISSKNFLFDSGNPREE